MSEHWTPYVTEYNPLKCGSIDGTDTVPHDHGVVRAMNAKYRPNQNISGDPNCTLFVAHLSPNTDEQMLAKTFDRFGKIKNIRVVRDIITGASKLYSFIEYYEVRHADRARRDGNKIEVDGNEVFVENELERTLSGWIPRRLGGGLGGKKEAGQLRFGGRERPFRKPIVPKVYPRISDTNNIKSERSHWQDRKNDYYKESRHRRRRSKSRDRRSKSRDRRSRSRDRRSRSRDRRSRSRDRQ